MPRFKGSLLRSDLETLEVEPGRCGEGLSVNVEEIPEGSVRIFAEPVSTHTGGQQGKLNIISFSLGQFIGKEVDVIIIPREK